MAPIRPSNVERRKWRNECRKKLSDHIRTRLGIVVEPCRVRLMPGPEDQYAWKPLPEQEYKLSKLFEKNMSDHSIGAYKKLCEGVGEVFEAVPIIEARSTGNSNTKETTTMTSRHPEVSFSAKIESLQEYNTRLILEANEWKDRADMESTLRHQVEGEAYLLRSLNQELELNTQSSEKRLGHLRCSLLKQDEVLSKILSLLQELGLGAPLGDAAQFCQEPDLELNLNSSP